jgi:hypothetical protein
MKYLLPIICMALLTGCAGGPPIDHRHASVSQDSRVRYVVLHYTKSDFPRAPFRNTGRQRQNRLGPVQYLNLALLVNAQDHGLDRWIDIQPDEQTRLARST